MSVYSPTLLKVKEVLPETHDIATLIMGFQDGAFAEEFSFKPGQFGLFGAFGEGECALAIASSPSSKGQITCSIKKVGKVTSSLTSANAGDIIGFRGPYGNWFPLEKMKGKKLFFIAGGIGFSAIRSSLLSVLEKKDNYKKVVLLYGARSVGELVYKRELADYEKNSKVDLIKTVDPGGDEKDWDGKVGFVPSVLEEMKPKPEGSVAIVCGPPVMIKITIATLVKHGFKREDVYTTLENRMKCGLGKCGRCNIGKAYVCKDGPVFTAAQIAEFPPDY
ncbi:heterodisulfide reductase subunit F [candidate division TA06 bacterium DG_26]|uniref:Heterodisulfide reductase subunit F n=1 Tax=candidate division TA06 bacterium DG_26 TaxID=1703771 RepID=A0A0S7WEQ7_UNCT6|nr:MAG: heterodisulfide reductase subunit F [candidate division TA06 bacterium DG_26]